MLEIKNLTVAIEGKTILDDVSLIIPTGKVVALMGPNGSGKSTLANVIMGNPVYEVLSGNILLDGKDITDLSVDKRAKLGLFLSFQHPVEVEGVSLAHFLRTAYNAIHENKSILEFQKYLKEQMALMEVDNTFSRRYLNKGFSGGEKKRAEMLQLMVLQPKVAILDETDSGLDVDALRIVTKGINAFKNEDKGVLVITHYNRMLEYLTPDEVYVIVAGKIVTKGGIELADEIEKEGFGKWLPKKK